jgi:PiT family inorganic phosphate transporter
MDTIIIAGIIIALMFNFVNGLNDAANSIATIVATRVLTPVQAVAMAAFFNLAGPLIFTTAVAKTIGNGIVDPVFLTTTVILIAMSIAVLWIFFASYLGIPISATHALVGSLMGTAAAYAGFAVIILPPVMSVIMLLVYAIIGACIGSAVFYLIALFADNGDMRTFIGQGALAGFAFSVPFVIITGLLKITGIFAIIVFIVISPLLGFLSAYLLALIFIRLFRNSNPKMMTSISRKLQIVSASFYSIGHGSNDAQNAMGVITALLIAGGILHEFTVPIWVILISCSAIALGTFLGGWKVVRTMAKKITNISAYQGCCAETAGGVVLSFITSFGVPVSTTHAITSAIMGVGASRGSSAVQWGMVREIVTAWILTIPVTFTTGFIVFSLVGRMIS